MVCGKRMKTARRHFLKGTVLAGVGLALPPVPAVLHGQTPKPGESRGATRAVARRSPRQVQNFDADWKFFLGDAAGAQEPGCDDRAWRSLDLPHDWSIEQPFDAKWASGTGYLPGGVGWYRKTFRLPSELADKSVDIQFDGVYMNSEVWLNGHSLGKRPYGYISFAYDLAPHLVTGSRANVLAVRVDHSQNADSRWYNGSGIYRHVWLTATARTRLAPWGVFVTTPEVTDEVAVVRVETRVQNLAAQAQKVVLETSIEDHQGKTVATIESAGDVDPGGERRLEPRLTVARPQRWSPDAPYLYTVVSRLRIGRQVVDEVRTPMGIRTFAFDPETGFTLNGKKTLFKGVCIHHDGGCLGAAVPDEALERRLRRLKEMGCNAIRTSHNPPAPEWLDWCDRFGMLVMDESFDEWAKPKKKWVQGRNVAQPSLAGYARHFGEWRIQDLQGMVLRDRYTPSIILWGIGNEIDYARDPYYDPAAADDAAGKPSANELPIIAAKLVKAVKELDTTRPVTAALATIAVSNRTGLADLLDVVGYNYQESAYRADHARYPGRKLLGSENSHAYAAWKTVEDLPYANGQFLWTGIDFIGEASQWPVRGSSAGALDECGFKKPLYYFRQSLWSRQPMIYLTARGSSFGFGGRGGRGFGGAPHWNWPNAEGQSVSVVCYTNCEKAELFLNEKSLGEKLLASATDRVLTWFVPFAAGTLKAVGKNGNVSVCSFELKTAGAPEQIRLVPDKTILAANGRSLVHVEVSVADQAGILVYTADAPVSFALSGPGRILGVDSGDQRSHESFQAATRKVYQGRCLVIVQASRRAGILKLTAVSPGLRSGECRFNVV
jgi:beta-galactosidase